MGDALNQGGFGSCTSHALVTVIYDQLRHRFNVQILTKEIMMAVIDAVDGFDGALVEAAAKAITEKPVKFINSGMDKLYQVKLDAGKRIEDFDEFAALVRASSGYCRAVVVVQIDRKDPESLHAIAAKGVSSGSFSSVECVNSWGDGGAGLRCVPQGASSGVEFKYAYFSTCPSPRCWCTKKKSVRRGRSYTKLQYPARSPSGESIPSRRRLSGYATSRSAEEAPC